MPKLTDSDAGKVADQEIVWTQNVDCDHCGATNDVAFPTGAYDEDGLCDVQNDDLTHDTTCMSCGQVFTAEYTGWNAYGEA